MTIDTVEEFERQMKPLHELLTSNYSYETDDFGDLDHEEIGSS